MIAAGARTLRSRISSCSNQGIAVLPSVRHIRAPLGLVKTYNLTYFQMPGKVRHLDGKLMADLLSKVFQIPEMCQGRASGAGPGSPRLYASGQSAPIRPGR